MSEKDVVITYETLFEMLRIEKNREDLQKLDDSFFEDVISYLKDKHESFESAQSQVTLFATDEKEQTRLELENIKKILKDIYDKREKKILSTAVNKAKTGAALMNTSSMLPSERLLFESLSVILSEFRKNILFKLASGELPEMSTITASLSNLDIDIEAILSPVQEPSRPSSSSDETEEAKQDEILKETPEASEQASEQSPEYTSSIENPSSINNNQVITPKSSLNQPKELKTTPNSSDSSADGKKVRFLASIGEIVGPDLQIYGPYEEGAVISLPNELARVLLEKKQAEEVTV